MVAASPDSRIVESPIKNITKGETNSILKNYGIGIDCHSKFYQTCILINLSKSNENQNVKRIEFEFDTRPESIKKGFKVEKMCYGNII
jgi:hypothetical protein